MIPPLNTLALHPHVRAILSSATAIAAALACQPQVNAGILTWDAKPATAGPQDGSGTWSNVSSTNWLNGPTNVQWNSSVPDSAVFGAASGIAGTVTLGSNISVDDITFNPAESGNYTIVGAGNTLTLVGTIIKGGASAILNANLAGTTGLTVTNTGTIRLGGANTYSGITSAQGRILQLDSVGALGNSTEIVVIGTVANPISTLVINVPDSVSTTVGAGKDLTLSGAGFSQAGAIRGADGANNTWAGNIGLDSFGAHISGGENGTLTITGVITGGLPQVIFSSSTNATTVLSAVNAYRGDTQLSNNVAGTTATLKIGIDNAIDVSSRLTVLSTPSAGAQVVDLNGHTLSFRALDTSATTTVASAANLIVKNNGATPSTLTVGDPTPLLNAFGGSIQDGLGTLSLVKNGENTQILGGANTYTGATTVNSGTLQLGGAPSAQGNVHFNGADAVLASTKFFLNGGTFVVSNNGNSNKNDARLPDTADLTFNGGDFFYHGTDAIGQNSSETVRNLILNGGASKITVSFGRLNAVTFNANQILRSSTGPTAFINGDSLGRDGTSTAIVGRFFLASAPPLLGTTNPLPSGINPNAKDTRIIPFLIGEATATTGGVGTSGGIPNTFLTYQAATGLRPLNPIDEFTNNSIVEGSNTRITLATTAAVNATINSLVMHGGNLAISQTLTNTSGAILFANGDSISGGTLNFGGTEGIITVNAGKTGIIGSRISATNGITLNGPGALEIGSADSTYPGVTTIRSGTLIPQTGSIGSPGAITSGPFGTGSLAFAGGSIRAPSNAPVTIANNILFSVDSTIAGGGNALTLSGPMTIAGGTRRLTNSAVGTTNFTTFSGSIGDAGQNLGLTIAGSGTSSVVLSGTNTYTGPTTVLSSTLIVSGSLSGTSTTFVGNNTSLATPARLGGSGTLGDVIATGSGNPNTSGAVIDPGDFANVAGIMKTGAFSLTNGAHLQLQIGGPTAGGETTTGYDQVIASGAVTLTGGDLKLTLLGAPAFTVGTQLFMVVNNSGSTVTGTFTTLNGAAFNPSSILRGGNQFRLAYDGNFTGAGSDGIANDVVLVAIPEPAHTVSLFCTLGLLGCRRRRHRLSQPTHLQA